ncbi:M16 family metallopeptidase [Variovorax sp. PCZ-1]|uniref:M16 family metallopeptidase n=1 Tax=Variovorax sp. PCZ-1 TaxID=2835533 RepID=UPI001BD11BCA|nr:M16 family metallopeptidase [Variovorax sp. PCZ-1]MBS7806960.1 insulinase family protein [Variovorax sp. PCZ-1]
MKKIISGLLASLSLFTASFVTAQTASSPASTTLSFVRQLGDVREYKLPNGLQVLLLRDTQRPAMSVNITYRVGSRHEGLGEYGSAHLLEHMLFKPSGPGTPPKYNDAKTRMDLLGMRSNGTTHFDRTNYFAHFVTDDGKLPERLDFMIGWLAAMMTQARFTPEDLKSEMTVVRNEFERGDNDSGRILGDRMRSAAYTTHGYGHPVIGTRADIENVPHERLMAFYKLHYRPDNATLIVAGDFNPDEVKSRIAREFGSIAKPTAPLPTTYSVEPPQEGEKQVILRRTGGLASSVVAYHGPAGPTREGLAAWLLATTIGQEGGPLAKALTLQQLAVTEWAYYGGNREPSQIWAGIGLPERKATDTDAQYEAKAQASSAALAKVMETYRPTAQELETARGSLLAGQRAMFRNSEAMAMSLSEAVARGDWRLLWSQREMLAQITLDEVHKIAATYLLPSNRTSGLFLPLASGSTQARAPLTRSPDTASIDRMITGALNYVASRADSAPAIALKDTQNKDLPSIPVKKDAPSFTITPEAMVQHTKQSRLTVAGQPGLKVAVMTRVAKDDRVQGTLRLRWGTLESVRGTSVLASMLGAMIPDGMAASGDQPAMDAQQIQAYLQKLDSSIRFSSSAGFLSANLEFPVQNTAAVLSFLNELLRRPAFANDVFERNQRAMIAAYQPIKSNPNNVAGNLLERNHRAHYKAGDPREVRLIEDTERQTREATAAQLKAYWQRFAGAQFGEFVLAGPLELAPVQAMLQNLWGDWASKEPHVRWASEHAAPVGEAFSKLQVPEKANATYTARIAFPLDQRHPDFPALLAGIEMMSRLGLWQRVREQEGISYGVGSSLDAPWDGNAASININASFAPQNLDRLRTAIREVLVQTREKGYSFLEVGFAKSAILARRKDRLTQPANAIDTIAFNLREDRALDANKEFDAKYEKLDAASVNAALKKYLDVSLLREVVAGTF